VSQDNYAVMEATSKERRTWRPEVTHRNQGRALKVAKRTDLCGDLEAKQPSHGSAPVRCPDPENHQFHAVSIWMYHKSHGFQPTLLSRNPGDTIPIS
jgi:hypothetical protein